MSYMKGAALLIASTYFMASSVEALVPTNQVSHKSVLMEAVCTEDLTLTYKDLGGTTGSSSGTFGDIMGGALVTDLSVLNAESARNHFSAMERVALTSNGNLQRILSAFHNSIVDVEVVRNSMVRSGLYERYVDIKLGGRTCCLASSVVTCHSKHCQTLIDEGRAGIGQIFTILGELPKFNLVEVGKSQNHIRRIYTLTSDSVVCHIEEYMPADLFDNSFLDATHQGFDLVVEKFRESYSERTELKR